MMVIHYYENKSSVLNQLSTRIPSVDEKIKIKGRNGTVVGIIQINDSTYHVHVIFEKVKIKQLASDLKKKKR